MILRGFRGITDQPMTDTETYQDVHQTKGGLYGNIRLIQLYQDTWDMAIIIENLLAEKFKNEDIALYWYEFVHPTYPQLYGEFIPYLSVVDLLFNVGEEAINYIKEGAKDAIKLNGRCLK